MHTVQLKDQMTGSSARIVVDRGFNCDQFHALVDGRPVDVIDADPDFVNGAGRASGNGIPILFPFPNRIRNGRYCWDQQEYQIPESSAAFDGNGNAIHGFCLDRPWRVIESSDHVVVGAFQLSVDAPDCLPYWPGDCAIEIRYQLNGNCLRADIQISNPGEQTIPWGFGTHPYFRLPLSELSETKHCLIQVPANQERELIDCLPTGIVQSVADRKDLRDGAYFDLLQLDDVLTGLQLTNNVLECVIMGEQAGLQIAQRSGPGFQDVVVYTPPGRSVVCIEPYTCSTDAINLQTSESDFGLRVLEPGQTFRTWIEIEASLVVA